MHPVYGPPLTSSLRGRMAVSKDPGTGFPIADWCTTYLSSLHGIFPWSPLNGNGDHGISHANLTAMALLYCPWLCRRLSARPLLRFSDMFFLFLLQLAVCFLCWAESNLPPLRISWGKWCTPFPQSARRIFAVCTTYNKRGPPLTRIHLGKSCAIMSACLEPSHLYSR